MANSYRILEGELVILKEGSIQKYRSRKRVRFLIKLGCILFSLLGSGLATCAVYQQCAAPVEAPDGSAMIALSDSITIGALFATFGSAVIGVFSLFAAQHLETFYEDQTILRQELVSLEAANADWKRWSFLPRMGKLSFPGKERYFGVNGASICFTTARSEESFPLPTALADFGELPILRSFLRMKLQRKHYLAYLSAAGLIEEYPAWDCVCAIYKSILLYRFSWSCIWIAAYFILQSIIFSFFYPSLFPFIPV